MNNIRLLAIADWVTALFEYLTSALKGVGDAILGFLKDGFITLFLTSTKSSEGVVTITGISEFGIFAIVMLSISLVIGLTYFITNLVRRKL